MKWYIQREVNLHQLSQTRLTNLQSLAKQQIYPNFKDIQVRELTRTIIDLQLPSTRNDTNEWKIKMNKKQSVDQNLLKAARQVPEIVQLIRLSKAQLNVLHNIQRNEQVRALTMVKRWSTIANAMSQLLRPSFMIILFAAR